MAVTSLQRSRRFQGQVYLVGGVLCAGGGRQNGSPLQHLNKQKRCKCNTFDFALSKKFSDYKENTLKPLYIHYLVHYESLYISGQVRNRGPCKKDMMGV